MSIKPLKDTLSLPQTDFPMRGNLAQREPERFAKWDADALYQRTLQCRDGAPAFILHDGPPYANGDIHMGHALNKILKDFVVRFKTMTGHRCPYVPGWDCHGLPIEQQILRKVGDKLHDMEPNELRELCHHYAEDWIVKQRAQFKRLGILGDWERPYTTVSPAYEAGILDVLLALTDKGLIRKGHKAVHWDPVFRTALAEAEIEYHTHRSPSIYVAIGISNPTQFPELADAPNAALVIWTTTPWTMPANMGVSLHPEFDYALLRCADGRHLIVADALKDAFCAACALADVTVLRTFKAAFLDKALTHHPVFSDRNGLVMLGEHVTLEQGTGCVHTAPGHGADDFIIGQRYGLPVFCPVNEKGCYTDEVAPFAGEFVFAANPKVVDFLKERGLLLGHRMIEHEYPYSWRSKQPIIFRATEQWFMSLAEGGVRAQALEAIDSAVQWIPAWGKERIRGMVERRPEWCISRQRHWGVPIPAVRSLKDDVSILHPDIIRNFRDRVAEKGTNVWYTEPLAHFLPAGWNPEDFEKEFDILDVWFDSGASHVAALETDPRLHSPADLYLEGSDQHRGWFQHALLTAIGARGQAPFKAVLTHGFVLDGEGKAMSKSMGNVISPLDLIAQFGTDILRLWVASTDYRNDVAISPQIVRTTADAYRTIRNTFRFQIGNLHDFNPATDCLATDALLPIDRWALAQLAELIASVESAYNQYEFHRVYQEVNRFYTVTLSAIYHDILKDRLYTFRKDSQGRRSAQTVIHHHLHALTRILAPMLVFTCDEAFAFATQGTAFAEASIHTADWPEIDPAWHADARCAEIESVLALRDAVNEQLEALRAKKQIGKSIEALLQFHIPDGHSAAAALHALVDHLPELFIVSAVDLHSLPAGSELIIEAQPAVGHQCPRCWRTVPALQASSHGEVCPRCADALLAL